MTDVHGTPHHRSYFYVGGEYTNIPAGHIFQHQMYVEKLVPVGGSRNELPIVFIHGGAQTGTNWLNKPDGNPGWASYFLSLGYEVYIVDQTHTGRSAWNPQGQHKQISAPVELVEQHFTATKNFNLWPQATLHTQWPGTGMKGDPIFDTYYASTMQSLSSTSEQERTMRLAGIALLDKIGPAILITHSRGGLHGWAWADARSELVKALVQVEPRGPPFREALFFEPMLARPFGLTTTELTFEPAPTNEEEPLAMEILIATSNQQIDCVLQAEPARQLVKLMDVPILVVTGEASYHATYDHSVIAFLEQAGCKMVEHMELGKMGIHGNGHMLFLEKNSDDIAEAIEGWIGKTVGGMNV